MTKFCQYNSNDALGQAQVYSFNAFSDSDASAMVAAVRTFSLAGFSGLSTQSFVAFTSNPPGGGSNLIDCAVLTFASLTGKIIRLTIPSPDPAIYLSDGETVDPTVIASLIATATTAGNLTTADGSNAATYISGQRYVLPVQPYNRI